MVVVVCCWRCRVRRGAGCEPFYCDLGSLGGWFSCEGLERT